MVHLARAVEKIIDTQADEFVSEVVAYEKSIAPVDTGRLVASIHSEKMGLGSYIVTTDAYGDNGFEYPARIEAGQAVYPTGKFMHNFGDGLVPAIYFKHAWHEMARPSSRSHFARNTVNRFK